MNGKSDSAVDPRDVRKTLVIGLDGASWDIIDPLIARGELPNLARILAGGVRGNLRSTIPPVTAVAWPSLYTGKNPGKHGIFAFRTIDVARYRQPADEWISAQPIAGRTIFDHLGSLGLKVCAYLAPITHPVWPINGVLVAGYPTPDLSKVYCHPPELASEISPLLPPGLDLWHSEPDELLPACFAAADNWTTTVERFLQQDQHHFYMVVENLTDYFVHRFWRFRDPTFPSYDAALAERFGDVVGQGYRHVDAAIGRMLELVSDEWVIAVVSDHGGGRGATKWFHVNGWLRRQGYLRQAESTRSRLARIPLTLPRRLLRSRSLKAAILRALPGLGQRQLARISSAAAAIDFVRTRAYGVDMYQIAGGVALNVRGRQEQGVVAAGEEYEALRGSIIADLKALREPATGRPIIKEVWRREELYAGPFAEKAPDVLFLLHEEFRCGQRHDQIVTDIDSVTLEGLSGTHRYEGVVALHAPGVFRSAASIEGAEIIDFLPTLYHAMGLPVPSDVDGKVLREAFEPDFMASHPVRTGGGMGETLTATGSSYGKEEEEGIRSALRGFGYVE